MEAEYPGYSWEGLEVETEDEYLLTLFHVWIEGETDDSKPPIMMQHGKDSSAVQWLTQQKASIATFAYLGHDVYIGNNRGVEYSQGHESLDMWEDAEDYWNFSFHEMAYDVYANVQTMYDQTERKGYFFGNDQGSIQMNVALALDETRLTDKLNRVIELAPCTVSGTLNRPRLT